MRNEDTHAAFAVASFRGPVIIFSAMLVSSIAMLVLAVLVGA